MESQQSQQQADNDFEKQVEKAKNLKNDLDTGKGWTQRYNVPNEYNSWSKTFSNEEVPVKTLFQLENLPMSAEKFAEIMHPSKMEIRKKWDKAFADIQILETFPDESIICSTLIELSFPFTDRDMVLHISPPVETEWFGKKAYVMFVKNATHASKPAGNNGLIRATNGGNFYISVPDEKEPGAKCEVFGLSNNNYNGWVPDSLEFVISPRAAKVFYSFRQSLVNGYKTYFSQNVQ